jgi:hypothetical protein
MATTTSKTAWAELGELDDRIKAAADRVAEAKRAEGRVRREVSGAEGRLAGYFADVEAENRPADPEEEAKLIAAIATAKAGDTQTVRESRTTAAVERLEALEAEREVWGYANVGRLVAELAAPAVEAKKAVEDTYQAHRVASAEYAKVRRQAVRVAAFSGLDASDVPIDPDRGTEAEVADRYARGTVELPLPRTLQRKAVSAGGK